MFFYDQILCNGLELKQVRKCHYDSMMQYLSGRPTTLNPQKLSYPCHSGRCLPLSLIPKSIILGCK